MDPVKAHVHRFRLFLFDGDVGKAIGGGVVDLDWSDRLRVTTFEEQGADRDGLLAFDVSGSNFGSGSQTHHVGHDARNGVDGTIETRTSGGWFGHVGANVTQKIVSTSVAAGLRFGEVGGVAVNVEDHVTDSITDCGVRVRGGVIKQTHGVGIVLFRDFFLLFRNGAKVGEHGVVDRNQIVQEISEDLLY